MAMVANAMASSIISEVQGCTDPVDANNKFYKALCNYVEANAQVFYSWVAFSPPPASLPDPMVVIQATIKTSGSLSPSGETTPEGAMARFSADLNKNAASWQISWPTGFSLIPALVIPTITITPSMADNQQDAWVSVCSQIISGLKLATPTAAGSHSSFTGTATFTQLI